MLQTSLAGVIGLAVIAVCLFLSFFVLTVGVTSAYVYYHPLEVWGYVKLAILLGLTVGILVTCLSKAFRNKWILRIEDVPVRERLILRRVWRTREETQFQAPVPGYVLYIPFIWKREGTVNLQPQVFDAGQETVNTIDGINMEVDYQLTITYPDDSSQVIDFYQNIRNREKVWEMTEPFLHSVLNLVTSATGRGWECNALKLAKAKADQLKAMAEYGSELLCEMLQRNQFGIMARVNIQTFILPPALGRAQLQALAAKPEAEEMVTRAKGQAEAMTASAKGYAEGVRTVEAAGGNITIYQAGEQLARVAGVVIDALKPANKSKSGEGQKEQKEKEAK